MKTRALFFILLFPSFLSAQVVQKGVADLRKVDFDDRVQISLNGAWNFSPSKFIASKEELTSNRSIPINVPHEWGKNELPTMGYGTYSLTLIKSESAKLGLRIPILLSAYKLYINGELITQVGMPGVDAESSKSHRKLKMISLTHLTQDTLNIAIQISNYTHSKGGINDPILIGDFEKLMKRKATEDAADFFLAGGLIIGVFFFFGLYIFGRKEVMALYFALFCLVYAYRIVGWGNFVLYDFVDIPYKVGVFLEFSSLYLSSFFFALYIKKLYPKDTPQLLIKAVMYFCLGFVLLAFTPLHIISRVNYVFIYGMVFSLLLLCYIIIKAFIRGRVGALFTILSTLGIVVVFTIKTLHFLDIAEESKIVTLFGQLIFFFFQAMVLSKHFSDTWISAKNKAEDAAKAKSEFVSVMSHEIRTPLNAVIGTTYHLIETNKNPEFETDLSNLKRSSENLLALINNVLDFSKIDSGVVELEKSSTNLYEFCEHALDSMRPLANQKGIAILIDYDSDLPKKVELDKVRLMQVLTNLIANAIKFTDTGHVSLVVKLIVSKTESAQIYFAVEDTGIGLSKHARKRIFEAFNQANNSVSRRYGGTGLGLTITKKLIELMKSDILVESELGKGSTFSFILDLDIVDTHEEVEYRPKAPKDISGYRILLVEDNSMNVLIATRLLHKWNLHVTVAGNGAEALETIKKQDFDLILMDLQMPVMDGYEATATLRQQGYAKPIIALTASPVFDESSKLKKSDLDGIISKPYIPNDLYNALANKLLTPKADSDINPGV